MNSQLIPKIYFPNTLCCSSTPFLHFEAMTHFEDELPTDLKDELSLTLKINSPLTLKMNSPISVFLAAPRLKQWR